MAKLRAVTASWVARSGNRVGVRDLRQNLSVHLRRVKSGQALEVMERGHAVAMLVPLMPASSTVDRLVAAGRATRARARLSELPAPTGPISGDLTAALEDVRAERL